MVKWHKGYIARTKSVVWLTPKPLFYRLDEIYDFNLDPCACRGYELCPVNYYDNGLVEKWEGNVFCNPPYNSKIIERFLRKGFRELEYGNVNIVCYLLPAKTDQSWFKDLLYKQGRYSKTSITQSKITTIPYTNIYNEHIEIWFLHKRLRYGKPNTLKTNNAGFASMIVIIKNIRYS